MKHSSQIRSIDDSIRTESHFPKYPIRHLPEMSRTIEPETVKFVDNGEKDSLFNRVPKNAETEKWRIPPGRIIASSGTPRKASRWISCSCDAQSNVIDVSEPQLEKQDSPMTVTEAGR
jgi:hypothetical protein